ncbi:MAG: multicopper oxidase domain-containing protein [Bacteroidia bacterium]|nr:multicopper oxidase domain-containing protein [Bacteroidia bacterium]
MMRNKLKKRIGKLIPFLAAGIAMASPSFALDVNLAAVEGTWTPPGGGTPVTMWGFISDTVCPVGPVVWDVGPEISVTAGDVLNVNLLNCLAEPVSIMIPGQLATMTPVWDTGPSGNRTSATQRVRSFTHETAPLATELYTWDTVRAGTYLYQSATHPALHVPMGLYGALKVNVAPGVVYPGVTYDNEVVLLYSEIDPALHDPPTTANPRNYYPSYYLVNGEPYVDGSTPAISVGTNNETTLVRFLNATLRDTVPTINGADWDLVAEDGNPYPYPKTQNSALMPAGKTRDAILNLPDGGSFSIYDRRFSLTNGADSNGGLFTVLQAAASPQGVLGIFNSGTWTMDSNGNGVLDPGFDATFAFGAASDIPVTGDWGGTGTAGIGAYRDGTWFLDMNGNGIWDGTGTDARYSFGAPGDIPVTGNWDGTGASRVGVYRDGTWFLDLNGNGTWDSGSDLRYIFGALGDIPVTGDWDGLGNTKIGVYRDGTWFLDLNGSGAWDGQPADSKFNFGGLPADIPVIGDWDGSGSAKVAVYRDGTWFLDINGNGAWDGQPTDVKNTFGTAGDTPVTLAP